MSIKERIKQEDFRSIHSYNPKQARELLKSRKNAFILEHKMDLRKGA